MLMLDLCSYSFVVAETLGASEAAGLGTAPCVGIAVGAMLVGMLLMAVILVCLYR